MTPSSSPWQAHGIGGPDDLPLPLTWAVTGAIIAVVVSFLALAGLRRTPGPPGDSAGRPLPRNITRIVDSPATRRVGVGLGLLIGVLVASMLVGGAHDTTNPLPWLVYVLLWVGLVPVSLAVGPVWRRVEPVGSLHLLLHRGLGLDPAVGVRPLPDGLGYWPAALGLLGFAWLELVVQENSALSTLRLAIGVHVVVQLFAGVLYGAAWFGRGEPFTAWFGLVARLSPWGRRADGVLVVRSPFAGLDALRAAPGLTATVMVVLGSTAYDSVSETAWWSARVQSSPMPAALSRTAGLTAAILLVWALFTACTLVACRCGGRGSSRDIVRRAELPGRFAPSVVPVALGYVVAHYYSLLVVEGQRALVRLSDPWGTGADYLGTAGLEPSYAAVSPSTVVAVQVLAIVAGHITGVVVAHTTAVRLFPARRAVVGQIPLLLLMIILTGGGLLLLFAE